MKKVKIGKSAASAKAVESARLNAESVALLSEIMTLQQQKKPTLAEKQERLLRILAAGISPKEE